MWRLKGEGLLEGCLWAFEAAFCLLTDHTYVGEELILGEAERVNCVYACPVSRRRPRSAGKHLQPDSSVQTKMQAFHFEHISFEATNPPCGKF